MTELFISPDMQTEQQRLALENKGITRNVATINTVLPGGQEYLFPDQYTTERDTSFEVDKIDIFKTTLPADVLQNEINEGRIGSDFDLSQAELRHQMQSSSRERLSYEGMLSQMAYELPYQLLNL